MTVFNFEERYEPGPSIPGSFNYRGDYVVALIRPDINSGFTIRGCTLEISGDGFGLARIYGNLDSENSRLYPVDGAVHPIWTFPTNDSGLPSDMTDRVLVAPGYYVISPDYEPPFTPGRIPNAAQSLGPSVAGVYSEATDTTTFNLVADSASSAVRYIFDEPYFAVRIANGELGEEQICGVVIAAPFGEAFQPSPTSFISVSWLLSNVQSIT